MFEKGVNFNRTLDIDIYINIELDKIIFRGIDKFLNKSIYKFTDIVYS